MFICCFCFVIIRLSPTYVCLLFLIFCFLFLTFCFVKKPLHVCLLFLTFCFWKPYMFVFTFCFCFVKKPYICMFLLHKETYMFVTLFLLRNKKPYICLLFLIFCFCFVIISPTYVCLLSLVFCCFSPFVFCFVIRSPTYVCLLFLIFCFLLRNKKPLYMFVCFFSPFVMAHRAIPIIAFHGV